MKHLDALMDTEPGLAQELAKNFFDLIREYNLPREAVTRLVMPEGCETMQRLVFLAHAEWQAEKIKLAETADLSASDDNLSFVAKVVYVQPPFAKLKDLMEHVSSCFKSRKFLTIHNCASVSRESRELKFQYVHLGRKLKTYQASAEIRKRGLRPALYEELLGFALRYPEEQRKHPIVALGSEAVIRDCLSVALLDIDHFNRVLRARHIGVDWSEQTRFLAVQPEI